MKTLIVYSTTHGCTEASVQELKQKLTGKVSTINLKKDPKPSISEFDRVIIGGSIHMGQIQKRVKEFCQKEMTSLQSKEIGLFICCMGEDEEAREELKNAFPEELHQAAKTEAIFGGEYKLEKMNFVERALIKKIAKINESVSKVNHEAIDHFANRMEKTYRPFLMLI